MRVVVLFGLLLIAAIGMAVNELKVEESGRWWYAPSRKAPFYEHKYQGIRNQLVRAAARRGHAAQRRGHATTHRCLAHIVHHSIATFY
jgi:hypothetical protein